MDVRSRCTSSEMKNRPLLRQSHGPTNRELQMFVDYDQEADAIYIRIVEGDVARSVPLDDLRMIDYAADGAVLGIEFVDVSGGVDLHDVPFAEQVEQAIRDKALGVSLLV